MRNLSISLAFILLAAYLIFLAEPSIKIHPLIIKVFGIAAMIFFGAAGMLAAKKLFEKKPGLIVTDLGIDDNSSSSSVGFIVWSDITGISMTKTLSSVIILIHILDPSKYFGKARKASLMKTLLANYSFYGTPIVIQTEELQIEPSELMHILMKQFTRHKG
ncbi:MAG TPA: STM3941 family protein [Flavobacterium sp.]|nr:STM3941 family protein [Flavobacterium sp.]